VVSLSLCHTSLQLLRTGRIEVVRPVDVHVHLFRVSTMVMFKCPLGAAVAPLTTPLIDSK
jgi:hypothetical protein